MYSGKLVISPVLYPGSFLLTGVEEPGYRKPGYRG